MASGRPAARTRIGDALQGGAQRARRARHPQVEERTKIRARYLRALEGEDWEVLPGPAYVRGFLRTYAKLLGLDGEMLVDEYRAHGRGPPGEPGARSARGSLPRRAGGCGGPSAPGVGPAALVVVGATS